MSCWYLIISTWEINFIRRCSEAHKVGYVMQYSRYSAMMVILCLSCICFLQWNYTLHETAIFVSSVLTPEDDAASPCIQWRELSFPEPQISLFDTDLEIWNQTKMHTFKHSVLLIFISILMSAEYMRVIFKLFCVLS